MKKKAHVLAYALFCFCMMAAMFLAYPVQLEASVSDMERITDYADILTDNEEDLLNDKLTLASSKYDIDIIVMTISKTDGSDLDYYVNRIYQNGSYAADTVLLAVNMDPYNREVLVQGQGKCMDFINNKRAQSITDSMVPDMKAGNYYKGILRYLDKVAYFSRHKKPVPTIPQILFEAAGALLAAGIIVFIMVRNAGGKDTTTCSTYMDSSTSKLLAKRDIYTHTTTTRHKIESDNNHSSGGGGGGGHSTGRSSF